MSAAPGRERTVVFLLIALLAGPLVLGLGMTKGLSHDEHQHVAAGALVAREGLMPYRDFPHFHTPYLPFIYALLFRATDHLLLAAITDDGRSSISIGRSGFPDCASFSSV